MKNTILKLAPLAAAALMAVGCTGDFAEMNTNPKALVKVDPEGIVYTAQMEAHTAGEYWGASASKGRWMRYGMVYYFYSGNLTFEYAVPAQGEPLYNSYNSLGGLVTNIDYLADNHPKAATYANLKAMARIMLIAKGIHASDMWGSLAYSEAWKARAGETDMEKLEPKFQTQEELSALWNTELKACIETLRNSTNQMNPGAMDRAYGGDVAKWIKAANAIRLRLASRLLKRQPDVAKAIAAEVLAPANAANVMGSTADSYILWFESLYTNDHWGDWHSPKDLLGASKTLIDFLEGNGDPRLRMFFRKNNLTPENIKAFNDWCKNTEDGQAYSGYDPKKTMDKQSDTFYNRYIPDGTPGLKTTEIFDLYTGASCDPTKRATDPAVGTRTMPAANEPQVHIFNGSRDGNSGGNWFPTMTHADFCFLASEFVLAEGVASTKSAQAWYEEGVKSSLDQWNQIGKYCAIYDYTPMTADEVTAYMARPAVAWAADPAMQLEQIRTQAWVDNFKNYDEAWAQWKRTNTPNYDTKLVAFEHVYWNKVELQVPRRVKFLTPTVGVQNEANLKERLDVMKQNPEFNSDLSNEFGRHWWDKQ